MRWLTRHHGIGRLVLPRTARAAEFVQLQAALERHLGWTAEFAAAGDLQSAFDARLDADAISDELCSWSTP